MIAKVNFEKESNKQRRSFRGDEFSGTVGKRSLVRWPAYLKQIGPLSVEVLCRFLKMITSKILQKALKEWNL